MDLDQVLDHEALGSERMFSLMTAFSIDDQALADMLKDQWDLDPKEDSADSPAELFSRLIPDTLLEDIADWTNLYATMNRPRQPVPPWYKGKNWCVVGQGDCRQASDRRRDQESHWPLPADGCRPIAYSEHVLVE